jgi:hypothetical protein
MHVLLGLGLLALGAVMLTLASVLAVDAGGFGTRWVRLEVAMHSMLGNRWWRGRERGLRRFEASVLTVIGLGAILAGLERLFGFGPS